MSAGSRFCGSTHDIHEPQTQLNVNIYISQVNAGIIQIKLLNLIVFEQVYLSCVFRYLFYFF